MHLADTLHYLGLTIILSPIIAHIGTGEMNGGVLYNPNFPAEFSLNKLPSRMYLRTICTDRCPVWFIMLRSDAPAIAALVACPARREWPAYFAASNPARWASFFTMRATSTPDT